MEYRQLGETGVRVSALGLSAMNLTAAGTQDPADCIRIVHTALDSGINLVDTADVYGLGASETMLGHALKGRRDEVVLATKGHGAMGDDINMRGNSRRWLLRACEDSLRRLQTDHIDIYQVHRPDPACGLDETLEAMTQLVADGKVVYFGTSTFPASQLVEAQWISQRRQLGRFVTEQPPYSILVRGIEGDVLSACLRHGIGVITWGPLAGGWLSGRTREPAPDANSRTAARMRSADLDDERLRRKLRIVDELTTMALDGGMSLPELAVAWAMEHPAVSSVLIGPRTMSQLDTLLPAAQRRLDDNTLDEIDRLVAPGTNVMEADAAANWLYGKPADDQAAARRRPSRIG